MPAKARVKDPVRDLLESQEDSAEPDLHHAETTGSPAVAAADIVHQPLEEVVAVEEMTTGIGTESSEIELGKTDHKRLPVTRRKARYAKMRGAEKTAGIAVGTGQ